MYKIKIIIGGFEIPAQLEDNPSGRDFARLLPLELSLTDYAGTEKVSSLPRKLSTEEAPEGYDPSVGDLTYYAPWGNLAIFYKDFGYARGLVKLGEIQGDLSQLLSDKAIKVRIEIVE